jgi:hypothetical protein
MTFALLAALGVPPLLVAGMLLAVLLTRRRITHGPGVFKARVKTEEGSLPGLKEKWSAVHAVWVHDVLLLFKGLSRARVQPLPVMAIVQGPQPIASQVKGLGEAPQAMRLRLDNGAEVTVAASAASEAALLPAPAKERLIRGAATDAASPMDTAGVSGS